MHYFAALISFDLLWSSLIYFDIPSWKSWKVEKVVLLPSGGPLQFLELASASCDWPCLWSAAESLAGFGHQSQPVQKATPFSNKAEKSQKGPFVEFNKVQYGRVWSSMVTGMVHCDQMHVIIVPVQTRYTKLKRNRPGVFCATEMQDCSACLLQYLFTSACWGWGTNICKYIFYDLRMDFLLQWTAFFPCDVECRKSCLATCNFVWKYFPAVCSMMLGVGVQLWGQCTSKC